MTSLIASIAKRALIFVIRFINDHVPCTCEQEDSSVQVVDVRAILQVTLGPTDHTQVIIYPVVVPFAMIKILIIYYHIIWR